MAQHPEPTNWKNLLQRRRNTRRWTENTISENPRNGRSSTNGFFHKEFAGGGGGGGGVREF
ncbi:hypothetical protein Syun_006707 [Stephania yunnanensis]|uniref:Uncharacterized protein n=1 Tax=Stephania yunnanensis TaxID=152371 RepID=A0AAP0KXD8_9MAGN